MKARNITAIILSLIILLSAMPISYANGGQAPEIPIYELEKAEREREAIEAKIALEEPGTQVHAYRFLNDGIGETPEILPGEEGEGEGEEAPDTPTAPTYPIWDGSCAESFASGTGTDADPYVIETAEQLAYFAQTINQGVTYNGKYVSLANDIYLNDITDWQFWLDNLSGTADEYAPKVYPTNEWTPAGFFSSNASNAYFRGSFNGNGHTVYGMYIDTANDYGGLFGYVYDGLVRNIDISACLIRSGNYTGAVVGRNISGYINNCSSEGYVIASDNVGGIVGYNMEGIITLCQSNGSVSGSIYVGGIAGVSGGDLYYSYSVSHVTGTHYVGGIVGWMHSTGAVSSTLSDCFFADTVTASKFAGGIVGFNSEEQDVNTCIVKNCYNAGIIECNDSAGAISGYNSSRITGCTWLSSVLSCAAEGEGTVTGSHASTDEQLKTAQTYSSLGFNTSSVWQVVTLTEQLPEYPEGEAPDELPTPRTYSYATIKNNPYVFPLEDPVVIIPTFTLSGTVSVYAPKTETTVQLISKENVVAEIYVSSDIDSNSAVALDFIIEDIEPGEYDIVVTKAGHLYSKLTNILLKSDVDITAKAGLLALSAGDINSDGFVDSLDIALLVYDLGATEEEANEPLSDLNLDGFRDAIDVSILSHFMLSTPTETDYSVLPEPEAPAPETPEPEAPEIEETETEITE